ncbi:MAG: hypothetical protein ABI425_04950 [Patescibacteria group bacterium]
MTETDKRRIRIEFIFSPDEKNKEERLKRARDVVFDSDHQGEIIVESSEILPSGREEVIILAEFPSNINVLTKKFDNTLHRLPINGGADAAFVGDDD